MDEAIDRKSYVSPYAKFDKFRRKRKWVRTFIGIVASVIAVRIIDRAEQDSLDKAAVLIWLIIIATLSFTGVIGYVFTKLIQL